RALGPVYKNDEVFDQLLRETHPEIDCDKMPSDDKIVMLMDEYGPSGLHEKLSQGYKRPDASNAVYDAAFFILNEKYGITREQFDNLQLKVLRETLEAATGIAT